jgi:hypothetical protein
MLNLNIKDIFSYLNNYLFNQQKILDAELNVKNIMILVMIYIHVCLIEIYNIHVLFFKIQMI